MNRRRARSAAPAPTGRRLDESMTLLREVMERPLDPGYAAAAQRREQRLADQGETGGRRSRRVLSGGVTALLAALAGFGLAVAVGVVKQPADAAETARQELRDRIEQTQDRLHAGEDRNAALRADIATRQQVALGSGGDAVRAQERRLGAATGALPVSGPGVELVVDDAPDGEDRDVTGDPRAAVDAGGGVVLDVDLQILVNGLWSAGAEAVAINGQRLSALSAIRSAGQAILVDFRPMVPPYRVQAIGDPADLQTGLAAGPAGSYGQMLQNSGIRVSIDGKDKISLPAAGQLTIRRATVLEPKTTPTKGTTS